MIVLLRGSRLPTTSAPKEGVETALYNCGFESVATSCAGVSTRGADAGHVEV